MSLFKLFPILFLLTITACQVEPLHKTIKTSPLENKNNFTNLEIMPVKTQIAQHVRNELIFSLQNNNKIKNKTIYVELNVSEKNKEHSILPEGTSTTRTRPGATAAYVEIDVAYRLLDRQDEKAKTLTTGNRKFLASYNITPQAFANQRARLNAQKRAAKSVAQLLRLAIIQDAIKINGKINGVKK